MIGGQEKMRERLPKSAQKEKLEEAIIRNLITSALKRISSQTLPNTTTKSFLETVERLNSSSNRITLPATVARDFLRLYEKARRDAEGSTLKPARKFR